MTGFDGALDRLEDDRLERTLLARQVYAILTDLRAEWSVRVGLLGPWGSGKTTVALWVKMLATVHEHVAILFNPWAVRSLPELWATFAASIFRALEEQGIQLDGTTRLRAALKFKEWQELPLKAAEADCYAKATVGVVSLVAEALLKISPEDIQRIREKLGTRRVIVIIDDLDRADPTLLPQLLLSLRELLDLPGFSFLLPFEKSKIVAALENYNKGWDGEAFLDKILDFRVPLPQPTTDQLQRMFAEEMKRSCPFVPDTELATFAKVLPTNPRRLKLLVRHIATLRSEAERHNPDELDWTSLVYATLLRVENDTFFDAYVKETFSDPTNIPWLGAAYGRDDKAKNEQSRTRSIIDASVKDSDVRERLSAICEAWRERLEPSQILRVPYMVSLTVRPDPLTWREFDEAFGLWRNHHELSKIVGWIKDHAPRRGTSAEVVAREFLDTALQHYGNRLEFAAGVTLLEEHERAMAVAHETFGLISALFLSGLPGVSAELLGERAFTRLLEIAETWIEFRVNPADAKARNEEKELLLRLVRTAKPVVTSIVESLARHRERAMLGGSPRQELIEALIAAAQPPTTAIAAQVVERLYREKGFVDLFDGTRNHGIMLQMLDPEGPLWKDAIRQLGKALNDAATNATVQKNALEWLELLDAGLRRDIGVEPALVRAAITSPVQISKIWRAATQQPLQFRQLKGLREMRARFIAIGAPAEALPVPDWLEAGTKLETAPKTKPVTEAAIRAP